MTDKRSDTEKIKSLIASSGNIVLVGHVNPDGDSIGSLMAMGFLLEGMGKMVIRVVPNELPRPLKNAKGKTKIYDFISSESHVRKQIADCDLAICLDFNDILTRLGGFGEVLNSLSCPKILIDHHLQPNEELFEAMISDTSASSTCFLVYKYIKEAYGISVITPKMASALYLGMMTDTGKFSYGNLSSELFRAVGDLVDCGADIAGVELAVFNSQSEERVRLIGYALNSKMVVLHGRKTAYITLSVKELNKYRHKSGDTDGLVNMPMQIEGIDNAALFIETDECIKISLRSRGSAGLDMNSFAREYFTGGGHRNAAGAKSFTSMDEAVARFLEGLKKEFEKQSSVSNPQES